jgi:tetratricopeptide (TPR) repeat protein
MLSRASAMTGGFTWDELRVICDDAEDDLLDALDEALGSQVIAEREHNAYAFTHALIRATLYDELSTPRRVQLHRRIAESLESLYAESIDDHLGELAAHYMASTGNAAEKAIEYSVRAGDRARDLFAWEEAIVHYERALQAMEIGTKPDDEQRGKLLLSLAGCRRKAGDPDGALIVVRSAAEISRRIGNKELLTQCALTFELAAYYSEDDTSEECLALVDEALAAIGSSPSPERGSLLESRVAAGAAVASARSGGGSRGFIAAYAGHKDPLLLSQAREALDLARQFDDASAICSATFRLAQYSWNPDNVAERRALIDEGCSGARRTAIVPAQNPLIQKSYLLLEVGDIAGFQKVTEELAEILERTRFKPLTYLVPSHAVLLQALRGEVSLAEKGREEYASASAGFPDAVVTAVAQLALIRRLQGRDGELAPLWASLSEQNPNVPVFSANLAITYAHAERLADAAHVVERMVADLESIPRDWSWTYALGLLSDACGETGQVPQSQPLYAALSTYASGNLTLLNTVAAGSTARVVGRLATMLERYDEAERHFETALASNERQGFHAWVAWTRLNYGDMLLRRNARGDRERAVALLQQAHDFAKESGMGKVERDSERLLARLG